MAERKMGDRNRKNTPFGGIFSGGSSSNKSNGLFNPRKIIGTIIAVLLLILAMSGIINQRKVVTTLGNFIANRGKDVGDELNKTVEGDGKVKITEDGVYFKDADVTDENLLEDTIFDEDENNSEK